MAIRFRSLHILVIASCLSLITHDVIAQTTVTRTSANRTQIPLNATFQTDGSVMESFAAAPSCVAGPGAGSYGLPLLCPQPFNPADITKTLNDLMVGWPSAHTYAGFLTMIPQKIDLRQEAKDVGVLQPQNAGKIIKDNYWGITPSTGIAFVSRADVFTGTAVTPTPEQTIFVQLDGFAIAVPVAVARTVQQDFVSGFVTRLVLNAYVTATTKVPNQRDPQPTYGSGLASVGLSLKGKFAANQQDFSQFTQPATYNALGVTDLQSAIAISQATQPIISYGLLLGWSAADDLLAVDQASHNQRLQKDFWNLLNYRYKFQEFGSMTAFTLDYLGGEAMNERIVSLLPPDPPNPPPTPISVQTPGATAASAAAYAQQLLQEAAVTKTVAKTNRFIVTLGDIMEAEFYAVSRSGLNKTRKQLLMARYMNLLQGYRRGVNQATNVVYGDLTGEVFTLAYADGFLNGYALGYAAGYKDGYAAGNADAWKQANAIIANLQDQIGNLQTQLNNANNDSGGNFWDSVGGILNDVGTAVGIIGSLF